MRRIGVRSTSVWLLIAIVLIFSASTGEAQKKRSTAQRLQDLEQALKKSEQRQLDLEARIVTLERLNLSPLPDALLVGYYRASRDEMTNLLMNIAANAFQYKIRPQSMGGGGGNYTGYKIPRRMGLNDNDSVLCEDFRDSVVFKGYWRRGNGSVRCAVNDTGRTGSWMYAGQFE